MCLEQRVWTCLNVSAAACLPGSLPASVCAAFCVAIARTATRVSLGEKCLAFSGVSEARFNSKAAVQHPMNIFASTMRRFSTFETNQRMKNPLFCRESDPSPFRPLRLISFRQQVKSMWSGQQAMIQAAYAGEFGSLAKRTTQWFRNFVESGTREQTGIERYEKVI